MMKADIQLVPNRFKILDSIDHLPSNIQQIGTEKKWSKGYRGKGVIIAVLDTGCSIHHHDLSSRIVGGYNFTSEGDGNVNDFNDLNGHGSHVVGVIAGAENNSGLIGIAPLSRLLILKVLNKDGSGTIQNLIKAIHYAIQWRGSKGERVNILSLSLTSQRSDANLHQAIKLAVDHQISVVAAAGNSGDGNFLTNEYRYPGSYPEVIEVGAINGTDEVAVFSNSNEFVDLYAPGVDIHSSSIGNEFATLSGTSMAAPHVAGALALLNEEYRSSKKREVTEQELFLFLMKHTRRIVVQNKPIHILSLSELN